MYQSRTIKLVHNASIECNYLDELTPFLKRITPDIRITSEEPESYNAWEWFIPATLILLLGKPLLDGFLKELGAEGARTLKAALKNVFKKTKNQNPRVVTVEDLKTVKKQLRANSETKINTDKVGRSAPVFTLEFCMEAEGSTKFVFPYELEDPELDRALDTLPQAVSEGTELIQVRAKLKRRFGELITSNLDEALKLHRTRPRDMDLKIIYVYLREQSKWIDVNAEEDRARAKRQTVDGQ